MDNIGTDIRQGCSKDANGRAKLDSLAQFHGAFWGLTTAPGLKSQEAWAQVFAGQMIPHERQLHFLDWFRVPEPGRGLFKRALKEISMAGILEHLNTFGTTVLHGDAHSGQFLCLHNKTESGRTVGLIDFAWAHLGNPAIDIGALMIWDPDHVDFITYYHKQLISYTGCAEAGSANLQKLPKCSVDEFIKDCRVAAALRGLFLLVITSWQFPDDAKQDMDYLLKHPERNFDYLTRAFKFFDEDTFQYLTERTRHMESSFLSLTSDSSSRVSQSVVEALSAREFNRVGDDAE
jgi:aminoglycoside/choline kinase family phosphotransferase